MKQEEKNKIIDYLCKQNIYLKQMCFNNLEEFDDSKLSKIIGKQISLEKITIKKCAKITDEIFSKFSNYISIIFKNYTCNLKTIYLSQLNFEIINTKLNIKYLYLSKLDNLKRLEITNGSTLKELYINSCENLNYICINVFELNKLEIINENISLIELYFEMLSIKHKQDITFSNQFSNQNYLFNNNGISWETIIEYKSTKREDKERIIRKIKTKRIFDLKYLDLYKTLEGHSGSINCLIELKNGYLASGSRDGKIKLWKHDTYYINGIIYSI